MIYSYITIGDCDFSENENKINDYASEHKLEISQEITDDIVVKTDWVKRPLYHLVNNVMSNSDELILYDAVSVAVSCTQVVGLFDCLCKKNITVHFVKYNAVIKLQQFNDSRELLSLLHVIEKDFISTRTIRASRYRKSIGLSVGRPKGSINKSLKLDKYADDIADYLKKNISKTSIARLVGCHPKTLYDWLERRNIKK